MNPAIKIKILIASDNPGLSFRLWETLGRERDLQIIGYSADEEDAMNRVLEETPDIVLVGLRMEDSALNGARLSRRIRVETQTKTLMLTESGEAEAILDTVRSTFASGYFFVDQLPFLAANIRASAQGCTAQECLIASSALSCLSEAEKTAFWIMMGKKIVLKSAPKTIANQKRRVVKKLGLKDQKELLHVFGMFRKKE